MMMDSAKLTGIESDRVASADNQEYTEVNVTTSLENDDDDYEDDDAEHGNNNNNRTPRRRSPRGSYYSTTGGGCWTFLVIWVAVMMFLGIIAMGLLTWRFKFHKTLFGEGRGEQQKSNDTPSSLLESSKGATNAVKAKGSSSSPKVAPVHYDLSMVNDAWNPFDLQPADYMRASSPLEPMLLPLGKNNDGEQRLGFIMQPDIVNGTLVFVSEGDLYLTRVEHDDFVKSRKQHNAKSNLLPAMKLTTTAGNVRFPKINPSYPYLIAYTATYTARREAYLLDLRHRKPATRLTYSDSEYGLTGISGWKDDGQTLIVASKSTAVSLPDQRLYEIHLEQDILDGDDPVSPVLQVDAVPLAQSTEGVYRDGCWYFTRYRQSSHTARYVGGTAESLWAYCEGQSEAVPLTADFNGTSKAASVMDFQGEAVLLFMSDRSPVGGYVSATDTIDEWTATSMNLWLLKLPPEEDLYGSDGVKLGSPKLLTRISCQFDGKALQEYSVDARTGHVVLRIGADMYGMTAKQVVHAATHEPLESLHQLPVRVFSDFHEAQERVIPVDIPAHLVAGDVFAQAQGSLAMLLTLRGQVFVSPVREKKSKDPYQGAGQNIPPRRYRVVPGEMTSGAIRVLNSVNVPLFIPSDSNQTETRLALILATDPLSPTAEHAFYIVPIHASAGNRFTDLHHLPEPFLGGHLQGGSTKNGGLGSVVADTVTVSPCGRRLAWSDTDGRICVMTLPIHNMTSTDGDDASASMVSTSASYQVLPSQNELGEPMYGRYVDLTWSPGGRYLAVNHDAKNQFQIISIVDCGDPEGETPGEVAEIVLGRIVQATPSRFNSGDVLWGKTGRDFSKSEESKKSEDVATTLYYLSDRDIVSDVTSPFGARAPSPHFPLARLAYALPLIGKEEEGEEEKASRGRFSGGGAAEVFIDEILLAEKAAIERRHLLQAEENATSSADGNSTNVTSPFPKDLNVDFGRKDLSFARSAYRVAQIPKGSYKAFVSQTSDDGSLILVEEEGGTATVKLFSPDPFPSDYYDDDTSLEPKGHKLAAFGRSTDTKHLYFVFTGGVVSVCANKATSFAKLVKDSADSFEENLVDMDGMSLKVWPALEYRQMYGDAWRLLRDYFYDPDMHQVDWPSIYDRYVDLLARCAKREEVDDVLGQMAAEVSALHVFVYGGEYNSPFGGDKQISSLHVPASLGAGLRRNPSWKGYEVTEIPLPDPDFNFVEGDGVYCPLSDKALRPSGQKGLEVGDVIVGVNGESVMQVPDIGMMLRGQAGRSVRLEVLRLKSGGPRNATEDPVPQPVVTVPISPEAAAELHYHAWEYSRRLQAEKLAKRANFTVAYIHLRGMLREDMDTFAREFFPGYDRQAIILDVRHNTGGNIDSWILSVLQRKAWMYWGGRTSQELPMGWDQHFAFRGHIIVLIDEKTGSDGESVSRGVSELGLGRLIGTRTWGGGIWLASDNKLVDGGIASAPEWGDYNAKFGWGMGIEQHGVVPDIEVDNNPRTAFDGKDAQLERAIKELKQWLKDEPVVVPKRPAKMPDMALHSEACPA